MAAEPSAQDFHKQAKDAGNKLRAYILSYSSAATGVFFLALTGRDLQTFSPLEKWLLVAALVLYVLTAVLRLLELRVDALRFYNIGEQLKQHRDNQSWGLNEEYKARRLRLIYSSYVCVSLATLAMVCYLILRIA